MGRLMEKKEEWKEFEKEEEEYLANHRLRNNSGAEVKEAAEEFEKEEEEYLANYRPRNNPEEEVDSKTEKYVDYSTILDNANDAAKTDVKEQKKESDELISEQENDYLGQASNQEKVATAIENTASSEIPLNEEVLKENKIQTGPVVSNENNPESVGFNAPKQNEVFFSRENNDDAESAKPEINMDGNADAGINQIVISPSEKENEEDELEKVVGISYAKSGKNKDGSQKGNKFIIQTAKHSHPHHRSEFDEVIYNSDMRFKSKKMVNKDAIKAGIALAVVIILVVFLIFADSQSPKPPEEEPEPNKTSDEPAAFLSIPIKYSFENYISPEDNNYNKEVSLICFLREEGRMGSGSIQFIDYYAVDDYGNKIKLNFFRLRNPNMYEELFLMNSTTKDLFNVSGSLRKEEYQELKLYVSNITPAERGYERRELK